MPKGIQARLEKLEKESQGFSSRARLRDGTTIDVPHAARLEALLSLIGDDDEEEQRPHPLCETLKHLAPREEQADPTICDLAAILSALEPQAKEELEGES